MEILSFFNWNPTQSGQWIAWKVLLWNFFFQNAKLPNNKKPFLVLLHENLVNLAKQGLNE